MEGCEIVFLFRSLDRKDAVMVWVPLLLCKGDLKLWLYNSCLIFDRKDSLMVWVPLCKGEGFKIKCYATATLSVLMLYNQGTGAQMIIISNNHGSKSIRTWWSHIWLRCCYLFWFGPINLSATDLRACCSCLSMSYYHPYI